MANISKEERLKREEEAKAKLEVEQKAKEEEEAKAKLEVIPTLEFAGFGWCEALSKSYKRGFYKPKTKKEYDALKKYAK